MPRMKNTPTLRPSLLGTDSTASWTAEVVSLDQVIIRKTDEQFEVTTPRAMLPAVAACAALLMLGAAILANGDGLMKFMGGGIVAFAILWLRELRWSGVRVTTTSIVERGDLRRKRWRTDDVRSFLVAKTPHIIPWQSLWIELQNAESQPLEQVRVFGLGGRSRERLERAAEDANTWLRAHRAGGSAPSFD